MNQQDLNFIERGLNIKLPNSYKKVATDAGVTLAWVYNDSRKIVSINKRLRKNGMHGQKLRENHFVFGYDKRLGGGQYYFIDVNSDNNLAYRADRSKIWLYNPDDVSPNETLFTFTEYIDFWRRTEERTRQFENAPPMSEEEQENLIQDYLNHLGERL